ncbi:hypothetical protein SAMN02949497_0829 [Methylomagnum ishizawai]|uniref:Uncharacterized protein n=1 Tax=Methylomagnum ishizawai TaxID=1760988 RepID=A0A1Y6CYZ8_9GAMM|nr:hypothetical protein [Methylomagnum ishizawai]SMF93542.1 hypothetical protein SAMN02949497_0829 [Methylomagnum ishizawai]
MLKPLRRLLPALLRLFHIGHAPGFAGWASPTHRPAWDNGIDYDIPTFLRRRAG